MNAKSLGKSFSRLRRATQNQKQKKLVRQKSVDMETSNLSLIMGQIGAGNQQRKTSMSPQISDPTDKKSAETVVEGEADEGETPNRKTSKENRLDKNDRRVSYYDVPDIQKEYVLEEGDEFVILKVRLTKLECCSTKTAWVFRTERFAKYGQADFVLLLEYLGTDDDKPPADITEFFKAVFRKTLEGEFVTDMNHTIFEPQSSFLGSSFISGVLYISECGQCFHNLVSPADYGSVLICRLIHTREQRYLKYAPLRLLVRLGYEEGVFPCDLISCRYRPAVLHDNDNSIYLLFRDMCPEKKYGFIPHLSKSQVTLEAGSISVTLTKETHGDLLRLLTIYAPSEDGLLAFSGELCKYADAHLVSIHKQRKNKMVTEVFNAAGIGTPSVIGVTFIAISALSDTKAIGLSGNVAAVIEDGILVLCKKEDFANLLSSLRHATDCTTNCDWFFGVQKTKVVKKIPLKFIWRMKPGQ